MFKLSRVAVCVFCFVFGFYVNGLRWQNKHNAYVIQQSEAHTQQLSQAIRKKDATINLLLQEGDKINSDNNRLHLSIGRLQRSIEDSNRKLVESSEVESGKLIRCQQLLSESSSLLGEGVELSTRLVNKVIIN